MVASFRKNIIWTVLLAGGAFVFSFASQIVISYFYGTSAELDAYWAALAIINLLIFPIHPFRESLVPEIHRRSLDDSPKNASDYFSKALTLILMIALFGLGLSFLFPNFLSGLVVSSSSDQLRSLVSQQLLWLAPAIILLAISETLNSLLASYQAVILQSVSRLLAAGSTLAIITTMAGVVGIQALALGFMGGQLITVIALYRVIRRHGLSYRFAWPINLGKAFFTLGGALLINYSASQIYSIYEKYIFSGFSKGLISAFQYGVSLTNVLITILGLSLANVFWPRFLGYAANHDLISLKKEISLGIRWIFLGIGFACSVIFINSDLIIHYMYVRGAFDESSAIRTSEVLRATIFTAIPVAGLSIIGRGLISFGMAKSSMFTGLATALAGITILWIAGLTNQYELGISHWLIANSIGLIVGVIYFLKLCKSPCRSYFAAAWILARVLILFCLALFLPGAIAKVLCSDCSRLSVSIISTLALTLFFIVFSKILRLIPAGRNKKFLKLG